MSNKQYISVSPALVSSKVARVTEHQVRNWERPVVEPDRPWLYADDPIYTYAMPATALLAALSQIVGRGDGFSKTAIGLGGAAAPVAHELLRQNQTGIPTGSLTPELQRAAIWAAIPLAATAARVLT